jgi:V8-like Glu-specific endopeptidase
MDIKWLTSGVGANGFGEWRGENEARTSKALVDSQQKLKHIWYLERAIALSHSVGRVRFPDGKYLATCFLVGPDLILTNHHVFDKEDDTKGVKIQFNYRRLDDGEMEDPDEYTCNPEVFITDKELDYTLVKLTKPATKWGYLSMRHGQTAAEGSHVAIIQHPKGEPLQIAMRDNSLQYQDDKFIEYLTNTDYGSSGSPVFNDSLNLVALHSQRVEDPTNKDSKVWYRNRGIRIEAILQNRAVDRLIKG